MTIFKYTITVDGKLAHVNLYNFQGEYIGEPEAYKVPDTGATTKWLNGLYKFSQGAIKDYLSHKGYNDASLIQL